MSPPGAEAELLGRARALGGRTIGELAASLGAQLRAGHKGAAGALVERALGIAPGSRPGPDIEELGIEVKTLPIARGRPAESTFVTCAPAEPEPSWERSIVRQKLARVLWIPVATAPSAADRRVGSAFLWSPDPGEEAQLCADWEALTELLASGAERVSGRHGRVLQLRPKAADGSVVRAGADADGSPTLVAPRAFYLRRTFTAALLERQGLLG